jgi:hypothetical protein
MALPKKANALIGIMALGALAAVAFAVNTFGLQTRHPLNDSPLLILLAAALLTARLKVKLPGLTGNMSVNLPFILVSLTQLSLLEALLVALPSCAVQCLPKRGGKLKPIQLLFNLSTMAIAVTVSNLFSMRLSLPVGVAMFFLVQTLPVAGIIRLTEGGALRRIWLSIAQCSFPFYVLSAGLTSIATASTQQITWQLALVGLPVLYAIYGSYQSYFRQEASA